MASEKDIADTTGVNKGGAATQDSGSSSGLAGLKANHPVSIHGGEERSEVAGTRRTKIRDGKEGGKGSRVTTESNCEGAARSEEPGVKCGSRRKGSGRLPCEVIGMVQPFDTVSEAMERRAGLINNAINSIFRG